MAALLFLLACASRAPSDAPAPAADPAPAPAASPAAPTMVFDDVALPEGAERMTAPVATQRVVVDGEAHAIDYTVLRRAGEGFGTLVDRAGAPIEGLCNEQDFNALLEVDGSMFLVSHFEWTPGGATIGRVEQADDGTLSLGEVELVDWSSVGGLWNPCAGQVSPWNTHLASEEYEPDGRREPTKEQYWPHRAWTRMKRYQSEPLNPWRYGWIPELIISDATGAHTVKKHLSPGRFSHEIAYVLPDQKTVYLSDDGYAVGWFLFIADNEGDLSAGTLYAARLEQEQREGGGQMAIEWVDLGHASDAELLPLVEARVPFSALFDVAEPLEGDACPDGFRFVRHAYGEECLALAKPSEAVPDPALAASRLETRRYAAWKGATMELVKGEGVSYDTVNERVYLAISSVKATMSDGKGDLDLDEVPCGVVYSGPVAAGVVDSDGKPMGSSHVMTRLEPTVVGRSEGKGCAADSMANPDNITFLSGYGQLVIAEDTSKHDNAFLWSYDVQRGAMQRLMVAPPYGELTGVHWIPNLGGFGYLTVSVQHPWSEGTDKLPEGIGEADTRSFTGVLGPFPPLVPASP